MVPVNTFVMGEVKFSRARIFIKVKSVLAGGQLLTVSLDAYDLNGNEGILVAGGLEKEIGCDIVVCSWSYGYVLVLFLCE